MEFNRDVCNLKKMLLDCCGLWGWTWSREFELIDTNCPEEEQLARVLRDRQTMEWMERHVQQSRMPMFLGNNWGMICIAVFQRDGAGDVEAVHILGPAFQSDVSGQMLDGMARSFTVPGFGRREIRKAVGGIPVISSVHLFQYAIFLHYCVTGESIGVNDLVHFKQEASHWEPVDSKDISPHAPGLIQKTLMDMVKTGNLNYHDALTHAASNSYGIRMRKTAPLQQAKYSVAIFTGLCTHAAVDGGLPSETAYNLCDIYVTAVEQSGTVAELAAVSHTMYDDLIKRVNKLQSEGISQEIRMCRDYITAHVEEKTTLGLLAAMTGYEEYYLSRKFKKETGVSINEFIRRTKIQRAKTLLAVTNKSIDDIAMQLRFSSRSYFTDVFQRTEGVTPAGYRDNLKNGRN